MEVLRELALFAGAGGGLYGSKLLGHRVVCAVEKDKYAASVLLQRQNDGTFEPFPIWDDVCSFDGRQWTGCVDVVSGGFPCTDIAICNPKAAGIKGKKSGLWSEMRRIIGEILPGYVFVENSPALAFRGLGRVLGDLSEMGYNAAWCVLGARHVGAPHRRDRLWLLASNTNGHSESAGTINAQKTSGLPPLDSYTDGNGCAAQSRRASGGLSKAGTGLLQRQEQGQARTVYRGLPTKPAAWFQTEPDVLRLVDGMAHRKHRLTALGNGQVPAVAAAAWRLLHAELQEVN